MTINVLMPALSPTMESGTLAKWLKKEGDKIKPGDIIAEVETDKATIEYEATEEGTLGKIIIVDGTENVKVNDVIAIFLEDGDTPEDLNKAVQNIGSSTHSEIPAPAEVTIKEGYILQANATNNSNLSTSTTMSIDNKKIFITPLAKRIAEQNNIDIKSIKGSGPNGRIIKHDVTSFVSNAGDNVGKNQNQANNSVSATAKPIGGYEDKPNSGMRKIIAKRLLESKQTIPH